VPLVLEKGMACSVLSSRGCVGRCTFCSAHAFTRGSGRRGWTGRSVASLVDELESLSRRFDLGEVVFVDDDFIGDAREGRRRAMDFASELQRRGLDLWFGIETRPDLVERSLLEALRAAGLRSLFMGIEAIAPRAQAVFGKRLSALDTERALAITAELDIVVHAGYIMFDPYTDLDEIAASLAFLRGVGQANPYSLTNALHVAPGTALLPKLQRDGMVRGDPISGFSARFRDEAVARLHTMVLLCVRAVFPSWYRLVRLRAAAMTELHHSPSAAARRRRDAADRAIAAANDLVCGVFEQALEYVRLGEPDIVGCALELREASLLTAARIEAAAATMEDSGRLPGGRVADPGRAWEVDRVP
jgi:hypothetical protein